LRGNDRFVMVGFTAGLGDSKVSTLGSATGQ
jgi:hypothetical protein